MSPPIRDGSGNDIGSIRLGDGSEISEVRTGAGDVLFSAIPDSVVSRPNDGRTFSESDRRGVKFDTSEEWPSIQGEISQNTANVTTAYVTKTDGTIIQSVSISGLSAGDVFTFQDIGLSSGTYYMMIDAGGSNYDQGARENLSYPFSDSDGDLTLEAGVFNSGSNENQDCYNIKQLGNINL